MTTLAHLSPLLSLRDVGICYQNHLRRSGDCDAWALNGISFDLLQGETLGVIGRNGAGKSTMLRLMAGIIAPDKGTMERHGARAALLSLQVGFMPHLTGRENALLSGILLGKTPKEMRASMPEIEEFAELGEQIDDPISSYSHGMRARLGFAVSFMTDPDILLVDEVLGVGDIQFRQKSSTLLKDRIKSDRTAVIVSHDLGTVKELCDRVVWIEKGELIAIGETEGMLERYKDAA